MCLRAFFLKSLRANALRGILLVASLGLLLLPAPALAQDIAAGEKPQAKALKYHEALLKRAVPGYLFDRFFNTWLDTGTLEELETFLKEGVKAKPDTPNRLLLAYFHVRQGNTVEAIAEFRAALEKDPGNADAWYQKGVVEARTLNFETALTDLQKASAASPKAELSLQIEQLRGKLLVRSGRTPEALEVWKKLLASRPDDEDLREDIVDLQAAEGLLDAASAAAKELVEKTKDPQRKILRRLRLGDLRQRAGQREEAADIYAACLADVGAASWLEKEILGQIDKIYRSDDQLDALEKRLQKLIEVEPRRISLRVALAQLLTQNGAAEPATKAWQEVLALTPGDQSLRLAFVDAVAVLAKPDEAIKQLEALLQQKPGDAVLLGRLTQLLFTKGDKPALKAALEKLSAAEDRSDGARLRMAALYDRYGMSGEGLAFIQAAAKADPASEALQDALAVALHKADRKEEAKALWQAQAKAAKDAPRLSNIVRQAAARSERDLAFTLMKSRAAEWQKDIAFLTELFNVALAAEKPAEALPWVSQRVAAPAASADADRAIEDAVRIVLGAKEAGEKFRDDLLKSAATPRDFALLAAILDAAGDARRADDALQKATAGEPLLGHLLQVRLLAQRRQPEQAAAALAKVYQTPEGRKTANAQRMASLLRDAGRSSEALKWIGEWKTLAPGATQPWLLESEILEEEGKLKEALTALRQGVQKYDRDAELKARLARLYRTAGQAADARRIYEQLFEDAADNAQKMRWVHEIAESAEESGRVDELVESFEDRRRNNRTSVFPLLALAEIHHVANNSEQRRNALLEAARIKPDDLELLLEIARVETEQGNYDNALATLRKAQPIDKTGRASQLVAQALLASGKTAEGLQELQNLISSGNADSRMVEQLAQSLLQTQGADAAAQLLVSQCERFPDDYRLRCLLVFCLQQSDQNDQALEQIVKLWNVRAESVSPAQHLTGLPYISEGRMAQFARMAPPGATEAFQIIQGVYYLASLEERRGRYRSYSSSSSGRAPDLPASLYEKDTLCLGWFAREEGDAAQSAAKLSRMLSVRPVPGLEALLEMGKAVEGNDAAGSAFAELARAHPDNELFLTILILSVSQDRRFAEMDLVRTAYQRLHAKYPQLGLMAALIGFREPGTELAPLRAAVLKAFAGPLDDMDGVINCLYPLFGRDNEESGGVQESKDDPAYAADLKTLRRLTLEFLTKSPDTLRSRPDMRSLAMQIERQDGDYAALLDLLNLEQPDAAMSAPASVSYGRSQEGGFVLPEFPPAEMNSVPGSVMELATSLKEELDGVIDDKEKAVLVAKWNAAVEARITDPISRTMLAAAGGDEKFIAACVSLVEKMPTPSTDGCFLMAAWEVKKENWKGAAEWVRRGLFLPLSRQEREKLDMFLTALVLEHREALGDDTSPLTAAAKDAALRLRVVALDHEAKNQLIEALESLGLTEAAEAEDKKLAGGSSGGGSTRRVVFPGGTINSSSRASGMEAKVKAFMDKEQKTEAVALLAKSVKSMLSRGTAPAYAYYGSRSSNSLPRDFTGAVEEYQLEDDLLAALHPESGASRLNWTEYVTLARGLFEDDAAKVREIMKQAVAKDPKAQNIRCRLAFDLLAESPFAATELIGEMTAAGLDEAASLVSNSDLWDKPASAARTLTFCKTILIRFKGDPDATWTWAVQALSSADEAFKNFEGPGTTLRQWLGTQDESEAELNSAAAAFVRAHAIFVRLASEVKVLAPVLFEELARHEISEGKPPGEIIAAAREMILHPVAAPRTVRQKSDPKAAVAATAAQACRINRFDRFSPVSFLVEDAVKDNRLPALKQEILAALQQSGRHAEEKLFSGYVSLFEVPESEFTDAARGFLNAGRSAAGKGNAESTDEAVLRVWQVRKFKSDLSPLVMASLTPASVARNNLSPFCFPWLQELARQQNRTAARTFLTDITTKLLGPIEKRAEVLAKNHESSSNIGSALSNLYVLFRSLVSDHSLSLLASEVFQEQYSPYHPEYTPEKLMQNIRLPAWTERKDWTSCPDYLKEEIALTPFVLDLPEFTPRLSRLSKPARFPILVSRLIQLPPAARSSFAGIAPKDTFGGKILHAAMNDNGAAAVIAVFEKEKARITQLPEARQVDLRLFADVFVKGMGGSGRLTPAAQTTLEWLLKLGGADVLVDPRLTAFLKTPAARSPGFSSPDFMKQAIDVAANNVASSKQSVADVLRHARKVLASNEARNPDSESALTQLGHQYFDRANPENSQLNSSEGEPLDFLMPALDALLDDTAGPGYFISTGDYELATLFRRWYAMHRGPGQRPIADIILSMAREANGKLKPEHWPVIAAAVVTAFRQHGYKPEHFTGVINALDNKGKDIPAAKPLSMVMRLGRIAAEDKPVSNPDLKTDKISSSQKWLIEALADQSRPLSVRFATACSAAEVLGHSMDPVLLVEVMKTFTAQVAAKRPWTKEDLSAVFECLLDAPDHEAVEKAAIAMLNGVDARRLSFRDEGRFRSDDNSAALLRVACRYAPEEAAVQMVKAATRGRIANGNTIPFDWLLLTLEGGKIDAARFLVAQSKGAWEKGGNFRPRLRESLPQLLETIPSAEERWALETRIMCLPDSGDEDRPDYDHARLSAFATRLKDTKDLSQEAKDHAIASLCSLHAGTDCRKVLKEEIADCLKRNPLKTLMKDGQTTSRGEQDLSPAGRILELYTTTTLDLLREEQNYDAWLARLEEGFSAMAAVRRFSFDSFTRVLRESHWWAVTRAAEKKPVELKKVAEGMRKILRPGCIQVLDTDFFYTIPLNHGIAEDIKALHEHVKALPAEDRRVLLDKAARQRTGTPPNVWKTWTKGNEEVRAKGIRGMLTAPWLPLQNTSGFRIMEMLAADWAIPQDVTAVADELLAKYPGDVGIATEVFNCANAADDLPLMLKGLARCRRIILPAEEERLRLHYTGPETMALLRLGRVDEARKILDRELPFFEKQGASTANGYIVPSSMGAALVARGRLLFLSGEKEKAVPWLSLGLKMLLYKESGFSLNNKAKAEAAQKWLVEARSEKAEETVTLLPRKAVWSYLDGTATAPAGWQALDFAATGWKSGPAPLGYGDPVTTEISFGSDKAKKPYTAWFRTEFNVTDPATLPALNLTACVDDGACFYLNGKEVWRLRLPAGELKATTKATGVDGDEETAWHNKALPATAFSKGRNVLAVEVHQATAGSSDLVLKAAITNERPAGDPNELIKDLDARAAENEIGPILRLLGSRPRSVLLPP